MSESSLDYLKEQFAKSDIQATGFENDLVIPVETLFEQVMNEKQHIYEFIERLSYSDYSYFDVYAKEKKETESQARLNKNLVKCMISKRYTEEIIQKKEKGSKKRGTNWITPKKASYKFDVRDGWNDISLYDDVSGKLITLGELREVAKKMFS